MTGWFESAIFIGATTAVTIIVKELKCKYNESALTVEMIVEVARTVRSPIYASVYPVYTNN